MSCPPICLCLPIAPVLLQRFPLFLFVGCVPYVTFPFSFSYARSHGNLGFHLTSVSSCWGLFESMLFVWWWVSLS
jgi:hypothetical protein